MLVLHDTIVYMDVIRFCLGNMIAIRWFEVWGNLSKSIPFLLTVGVCGYEGMNTKS